jgi:hypothetical protein
MPHRTPTSADRSRLLRRAALLLAALVAVLAGPATAAQAASYTVFSCKTPAGVPTSTLGWTASSSVLYENAGNDCALGGRLSAKFTAAGGAVSGGLGIRWSFNAPAGTTIQSAVLNRSSVVRTSAGDHGASAATTIYKGAFADLPGNTVERCASAGATCGSASGQLTIDAPGAMVGFAAGCSGPAGTSSCDRATAARARIAVDSAKLVLADTAAPTVTNLHGPIAAGDPLKGTTRLQFSAADVGSGVFQAEVTIGGVKVVPRRAIDANGGECKLLHGKGIGAHAFASPQPCKTSLDVDLPVNTTRVGNGPQLLSATIWDASGNATAVVSKQVTITNPAPPPGKVKLYKMPAVDNTDAQLDGPETLTSTSADGTTTTTAPAAVAAVPPAIPNTSVFGRVVSAMHVLDGAHLPYCWGGGHQTSPAAPSSGSYCWFGSPAVRVNDPSIVGLDCSSSVSWILQAAGYPIPTMTSGEFANFGEPGEGKDFTIWANSTHVYVSIVVEGATYYWGTSTENYMHGPGWHTPRSGGGFVARHIPGL